MDGIFNAVDVFKIAETIERNGAQFYNDAAKLFPDDKELTDMFKKLAKWELEHKDTFAKMKQNITLEHPKLGPGTQEYKAVAALSTFSLWSEPYRQFTGIETVDDVIRQALRKEKDTIVFYVGLRDFIKDSDDQDILNKIVNEEMTHITVLTKVLSKIK